MYIFWNVLYMIYCFCPLYRWRAVVMYGFVYPCGWFNTLSPRQDGRHSADDIFRCIFFNANCCILIKFSLKYVRKGPIDNNPALVQIMAWRRPGGKPLSEPTMVSLPTHICVTRPQWVNPSPSNNDGCGVQSTGNQTTRMAQTVYIILELNRAVW